MNKLNTKNRKTFIKFLIMDVDGTLTDGKIYISSNGELMKGFNIKDGYGIKELLPRYKIEPVIITGRNSEIVKIRATELNIQYLFQGISDKKKLLYEFLENRSKKDQYRYTYANCIYIGDDIPDLLCMSAIKEAKGIVACPSDAVKEIKDIADFISQYPAGKGAVRDVIEFLIS